MIKELEHFENTTMDVQTFPSVDQRKAFTEGFHL